MVVCKEVTYKDGGWVPPDLGVLIVPRNTFLGRKFDQLCVMMGWRRFDLLIYLLYCSGTL